MGGVASTTVEDESQLAVATGSARTEFLKKLAKEHKAEDQKDFYELFGLERYVEIEGKAHDRLKAEFRSLMRRWHPDKNENIDVEFCNVVSAKISLAKRVLEDPDLKRRYDEELREQLGEEDGWSTFRWWCRWGFNVAAMAGGITLIGACAAGLPFTAGASGVPGVAGSSLLAAGMQGSAKMLKDPKCSSEEFAKDIAVGATVGAVAGSLAAGLAPTIAGCSSLGGQVAIAAGVGVGATTSGKLMSDGVDLAITEGLLGETAQKTITDCKTREEVFSANNAKEFAKVAALGAVAGAGAQLVVAVSGAAGAAAEAIADDAANGLVRAKGAVVDAANALAPAFKDTAKGMAVEAAQGAAKVLAPAIKNSGPVTRALCLGQSVGALCIHSLPPVHERIKKLAPEVAHRLVDDARKADFMLSRTNIQKDFADHKVAQLLRDGFRLCADNSLKGGWGGRGWVERYVKASEKTTYGILVVEGGEDFFQSKPCCDELYAAQEAGINLTKVHGKSILSGEYLWVKISKDVFSSAKEYEKKMRPAHGEQFTPFYHTASLGGYYKSNLDGVKFTYYCIVPRGRGANATGAAAQCF